MKRTRHSQLRWPLAILTVALMSNAVRAETSSCILGQRLRAALGFGSQELAAMGVASNNQTSIINAATTFCDQNRETIEPLITAYISARQAMQLAYENGDDPTSTDAALLTAMANLESASSTIITSMCGHLSGEQQTVQAQLAANRLLDTSIALLDLSSEQRTALRAAQRTRDAVMRHQKTRKNASAVAEAHADFEAAVAGVLDGSQETQRGTNITAQRTNIDAAQTTEINLCN